MAHTGVWRLRYWHIERARIGKTRTVPLEVLVNGFPAAMTEVIADGSVKTFSFELTVDRSSWIAARILPSSHTNPVWVIVDKQPVRAYRRSLEWCLAGVDNCWKNKERFIKADEMEDAKAAYEHARTVYRAAQACHSHGCEHHLTHPRLENLNFLGNDLARFSFLLPWNCIVIQGNHGHSGVDLAFP